MQHHPITEKSIAQHSGDIRLNLGPVLLYAGILCIEALALGFSVPLIALVLEYRNHSDTAVGVMTAIPAAGILAAAFLAPRILVTIRAHRAVSAALMLSALSTGALLVFDSYESWLCLRFLRGFACGFVFLVGEYCLNTYVPDRLRGRVISVYASAFAIFLFVGPWILSAFEVRSDDPFVFMTVVLSLTALVHILLSSEIIYRTQGEGRMSIVHFFRLAPMIAAGIMFGSFYETNFLSFMPLYALSRGYEEELALLFVSVIFIGDAAMQYPIGWLADRFCRRKLQLLLAFMVLALTLPLPWIFANELLVWPVLFLLGACAGGIYTLSLVRMGAIFSGRTLIRALSNSGIVWGIGSFIGPSLSGMASDLIGDNGFIYCLVAVTATVLLLSRFDTEADRPA